jgi:lipopolysaccharide/colanic/teichoic acid biosynthesis glycosyltransferase
MILKYSEEEHRMIDAKARINALSQSNVNYLSSTSLLYTTERPLYEMAKRMLDVLVALVALIALAPLMVVIAAAVRLDSAGAAIYAQRRVGKGGELFTVLKFRSMVSDSDESLHREFAKRYINGSCQADENGCYKVDADPRITKMGRLLRATSLDELPQLINVLKGDMSLVGPRPAVAYEVEEYERWQTRRLAVMPGMTGLAQVNGRSGLAFSQLVRHDLEYVEKRNIMLDLAILAKTVPTVLMRKAAG